MLSLLLEKFWILGRRIMRKISRKCVICKRLVSKPFVVYIPPLPVDRVRDAATFQVVGVDFAGSLCLVSDEKAWICLFTCAVYWVVHLELTLPLSTVSFSQDLHRFVAKRGRPNIIYSDNGTNFKGAENELMNLNWKDITRETSTQRIVGCFTPLNIWLA